jgi:hypothetical protein
MVHNLTAWDGSVEIATLEFSKRLNMRVAIYTPTDNVKILQYTNRAMKHHILEARSLSELGCYLH